MDAGITADSNPQMSAEVGRPASRGGRIRRDAPLVIVLVFMLLAGVVLRVQNLGAAHGFKWDEHHFVLNARNYLVNKPDQNDHPPLSKLIIASVMSVTGDTPAGWRTASLLFGLLDIGLIAWVTWLVFQSRRAALIAAAFVAADGMFIAYSRTALFDGVIVAFLVAGLASVFFGRTLRHVLLCGLFIGCVMSLKLSGLAIVPLALLACFVSRPLRRWTPLLALCIPLVFYLQYALALHITGRPASLLDVIADNRSMVHHHLSFTYVHPSSSKWYTWFLPVRPFFFRREQAVDGTLRALMLLGNPALWWASSLAVIATTVVVWKAGWRRIWQQVSAPAAATVSFFGPGSSAAAAAAPLDAAAGRMFWLLAAWAAPVAFWIPSLRDSFLYHYMPSYAFALMLLAGFADRLYVRHRLATLIGLVIVAEVLLFYAPLWGELPIGEDALNARLFEIWR
jgi:dolichyl-phosphate-mannose-protein mannosyltransferase